MFKVSFIETIIKLIKPCYNHIHWKNENTYIFGGILIWVLIISVKVYLSCKPSSANTALGRLFSFMNWCHMSTHLPFLCKACITNITIERLFLHELLLVQETDEKFEPFNDKNAIGVTFWSFMILCHMLVQPWKPSVLNKNWSFFKII